jgi:hypothetical protein
MLDDMKTAGLYRHTIEDGSISWAQVTDGTRRFNVPEEMYRAQGYEPAYEQLPDKAAFETAVRLGLMMQQMALPADDTPPAPPGTAH